MKTCSVCNATKDLNEFDKRRNTKGEQVERARCKACRRGRNPLKQAYHGRII